MSLHRAIRPRFRLRRSAIVIAVLAGGALSFAHGLKALVQAPPAAQEAPRSPETQVVRIAGSGPHRVSILLGRSAVLVFDSAVDRIAIGDPRIAEVAVVTGREFLLNARRAGSTNVIVWGMPDGSEESGRTFIELRVDFDIEPLRRHVREIHPNISVESSPLGNAVILRGRVPNRVVMALAVDAADQYLRGIAGEMLIKSNPVIKAEPGSRTGAVPDSGAGEGDDAAAADEPAAEEAAEAGADVSRTGTRIRAAKVINMMTLESLPELPEPLDKAAVLERELMRIDPGIAVRRLQVGDVPDDESDSFLLEGTVRTGAALTRALAVADRFLGGRGEDFTVVADVAGVLANTTAGLGAGGQGGNGGGTPVGEAGGARLNAFRSNLRANLPRGLVITAAKGRLVSLLKVLDVPQVLVAVRILEINRSRSKELGIDWRWDAPGGSFLNLTGVTGATLPVALRPLSTGARALGSTGRATQAFVTASDRHGFAGAIRWLEDNRIARSLAEPNLVTLSGERASFIVGGEVPILTTTSTVTAALQGFEFREFGIRLDILPAVGEDGSISMEVTPQVSTPDFAQDLGAPSFSVRGISTVSQLREGEALVIGGLIDKTETYAESKTPFLGDIPILGALFSNKQGSGDENELVFILSPRIVRPAPAMEVLADWPPIDAPIRPGKWIGAEPPPRENDEIPEPW